MTALPTDQLSVGRLLNVNVAGARDNPFKRAEQTGIDKRPVDGSVEVRAPGSKAAGLGSGLVGDFIGDRRSHGGDDQAVYAYAIEDFRWWTSELGAPLTAGQFGENLTTEGLRVNDARIGERWKIGADVELQVTGPRIPCGTFRGWMDRPGWLKIFTRAARSGAYLRVVSPGLIRAGDAIAVVHRPDHEVTVTMVFRALLTEPTLLPQILAAPELPDDARAVAESGKTYSLDL